MEDKAPQPVPIYVSQLRKILDEINHCANDVSGEYENVQEPITCNIDAMCAECKEKLINLLDWSDLSEEEQIAS